MQLILWRHAQAEDGRRDLERELTAKGRKQAAKMAAWLRQRMPDRVQVFVSPALRAQQTADALSAPMKTINRLAPGAAVADVLDVVSWPGEEGGVAIVVGHQPTLGEVAARLVGDAAASWSVRKGGIWWLERRARGDRAEVLVRAVISPDLI